MPFHFRLGKRSQQYNVANKDLFVIPIELLTNECIECTLLSNSIGQECLNNVCQKINLHQPEYFCLLFKSKKNVDQWVDLNKPLKKQLDKYASEVRLYFRLQYFVPNFHFLSDEISRYHYFCAMKGLVIDGRIACSRDDAILLASFSLQAEFGDYSPERHTVEYLNNFSLFPKSMVTSKIARDVLIECAINAYRNLQGVPTNVAEIYYISEAQRREGYGQEGFPARDLDTGQDVCLGVCIRGIFIVNTDSNTLELFKWMDIANLIHNKKVFTIERNIEKYSKNYSTYDSDYASCIWRSCVEQHQYFMKGIQTVNENEATSADHGNIGSNIISAVSFMQNNDLYNGNDNFIQHKTVVNTNSAIDNSDYRQIQLNNSLYETLNKSTASHLNMSLAMSNLELSKNIHEYNVNGCNDKMVDQNVIRQRSSTEPVDLHHITVSCANNFNKNSDTENDNNKHMPSSNSPSGNCSTNTPIYENQLNSSDLTYEQRKKLLPAYRKPPDYDTFLKQKYSAMAYLSQSLSSIPSRLASHNQINSSSSSSLAQQNQAIFMNGTKNITSSSSTMSVPHLVQQHARPSVFSANIYKNYVDLSNLELEKQPLAKSSKSVVGSLPPVVNLNCSVDSLGLDQFPFQKQSTRMFTSSSPELNTLNLLQKRNVQFKSDIQQPLKQNGLFRVSEQNEPNSATKNYKDIPHHFTSVPDLTFKNSSKHILQLSPEMVRDNKKLINYKTRNFFAFGGKNFRLFRSQNNTGSEPNLFNTNPSSPNCYNLQSSKLSVEQLNNLNQQRRNSITTPEQASKHSISYSISPKIDETPELQSSEQISSSSVSSNYVNQIVYGTSQHLKPNSSQVIYVNLNSVPANTTNSSNYEMPSKVNDYTAAKRILPQVNSNMANDNFTSTVNRPINNQISNALHQSEPNQQISKSFQPNHQVANSELENKITSPKSIKNSRIIVFDKSFDDQDFTREFELLPRMNPTAKFTTASLGENILKNRFRDILPYEENR